MKLVKGICLMLFTMTLIQGCSPEEDGTALFEMNFSAIYNAQPLVMNQVIDYNGSAMRINVSEFYVSEIRLSNESTSVDLGETQYVSFTGSTGPAVSTLTFNDVPVDRYTELSFFIGVPADLNAMAPEDFTSSQALSNSATYWEGWKSYIFSKLEGKLDTEGDGETDLTFVYHSGKDELYTEVIIPLPDNFAVDGTTSINLDVEHQSLFKDGNGGYLDIEAKPTAHNPDDLEYPTIILGNFQNGFSLD